MRNHIKNGKDKWFLKVLNVVKFTKVLNLVCKLFVWMCYVYTLYGSHLYDFTQKFYYLLQLTHELVVYLCFSMWNTCVISGGDCILVKKHVEFVVHCIGSGSRCHYYFDTFVYITF